MLIATLSTSARNGNTLNILQLMNRWGVKNVVQMHSGILHLNGQWKCATGALWNTISEQIVKTWYRCILEYYVWLFFTWVGIKLRSSHFCQLCHCSSLSFLFSVFFIPHPSVNYAEWGSSLPIFHAFFSKITRNSHLAELVVGCGLSFSLFYYHNF